MQKRLLDDTDETFIPVKINIASLYIKSISW
jgi:hypothetical protein